MPIFKILPPRSRSPLPRVFALQHILLNTYYAHIVRRTRIVYISSIHLSPWFSIGDHGAGYRSSTRARPCHPALNREIQLAALLLAELVSFLDKIQPRFLCVETLVDVCYFKILRGAWCLNGVIPAYSFREHRKFFFSLHSFYVTDLILALYNGYTGHRRQWG